jgi:hypothetical protein
MLISAWAVVFEKSLHHRLDGIRTKVLVYRELLLTAHGGISDSEAATVLLFSISNAHLEARVLCGPASSPVHTRPPVPINRASETSACAVQRTPHGPVMTQFRNDADPTLRVDATSNMLTLLVVLLDHIRRFQGLVSECARPWGVVEAVFSQSHTAAKVRPGTTIPVTRLAWETGYDPKMSEISNPHLTPWLNRASILGSSVQYCLIFAQWVGPICLSRLLTEHDLSTMLDLISAMHKIHFDHFMPSLMHKIHFDHFMPSHILCPPTCDGRPFFCSSLLRRSRGASSMLTVIQNA